jgi:hypothetical protein
MRTFHSRVIEMTKYLTLDRWDGHLLQGGDTTWLIWPHGGCTWKKSELAREQVDTASERRCDGLFG